MADLCDIIAGAILLFIILSVVVSSCSCYYGSVSAFANVAKTMGSNMMTDSKKLSHEDKVKDVLEGVKDKPCMIAVLADFCGYCKQLKNSGELEKLAKKHKVFVMDEEHPESHGLMGALQSQGYPTLVVYKKGKMYLYDGKRDAESMEHMMDSL